MKIDPIDMIPGPCPWYIRIQKEFTTKTGTYIWNESRESGPLWLSNPMGNPILLLNTYSYVKPRRDDHILLWYEDYRNRSNGSINFQLYCLASLGEIANLENNNDAMEKNRAPWYIASQPLAEFAFHPHVSAGKYTLSSPSLFSDWGEVLVLGTCKVDDHLPKYGTGIFAFSFDKQTVEVYPQDWFNNGDYDFGYQWITRVARDDKGRIFGDGIRLDRFRLDASARKIETKYFRSPYLDFD